MKHTHIESQFNCSVPIALTVRGSWRRRVGRGSIPSLVGVGPLKARRRARIPRTCCGVPRTLRVIPAVVVRSSRWRCAPCRWRRGCGRGGGKVLGRPRGPCSAVCRQHGVLCEVMRRKRVSHAPRAGPDTYATAPGTHVWQGRSRVHNHVQQRWKLGPRRSSIRHETYLRGCRPRKSSRSPAGARERRLPCLALSKQFANVPSETPPVCT